MKMPRRITLGLASAAAVLMLVAAPLPAQAAAPLVDVTGLSVKDVLVGKDSGGYDDYCRDLMITPKFKLQKGVKEPSVNFNLYRGSRDWAYSNATPGLNRHVEWCPSDSTLGKQTVITGEVSAWYRGDLIERRDTVRSAFYIRTESKAALAAKRTSKKTVKLSISAKNLSISADAYKPYAAKKVSFQVKSGSKWKTFKTVNLGKKGTASVTVKRTVKANYRVVVPKTDSKAGVTTKTVKK